MAAGNMSALREASRTGRPVEGATFKSKRERKAYRKTLRLRAANMLADRSLNRWEKAEFYKKLRLVKLRRRQIAGEFWQLVDMLSGMQREINRVHDRVRQSDPTMVDWVAGAAGRAVKAMSETATDYAEFSRRTVLRYRTDGGIK